MMTRTVTSETPTNEGENFFTKKYEGKLNITFDTKKTVSSWDENVYNAPIKKGWDLNKWFPKPKVLNYFNFENKPILRPLSDLTKEIEVNREKFIPVEYFEIGDDDSGTKYTTGNIKTIEQLIDISKHNSFFDINYMPFALVQQLLEWHFDVFYLIEKGLAIDINTLEK